MFSHVSGHTFISAPLNERSIIVDLGANRGKFSRKMKALYGANIHLVEANPELARQLAELGLFQVNHCAVADREGVLEFHIAANDEGSSLLTLPETSILNCTLRETVSVPARTLKSLLDEHGITEIDLLKMDIEGAEVALLNQLDPEMLAKFKQMNVEFHCDPIFGFGKRKEVDAIIRRLEEQGFVWVDFSHPRMIDVLFINTRYHKLSSLRLALARARMYLPPGPRRLYWMIPHRYRVRLRRLLGIDRAPTAKAAAGRA